MTWNRNLAYCFVHDTSLPIPIINEELFNYYLDLYEEEMHSRSKWNDLLLLIKDRFNNDPDLFDKYRKEIRGNIIDTVTSSDAYKKFNGMDMQPYSVNNSKYKVSKSVYIEPNIGKLFISLDLKSANFQVMKYIDKDIMLGADTYEEFMRNFTDIDYFINQKYIRQVIFGQMNPSRHFTLEKYLIHKIMEYIDSLNIDIEPVAISSDEVVYCVDKVEYTFISEWAESIKEDIKSNLGIEVSTEVFKLNGYGFYSHKKDKKIFTFYDKVKYNNGFLNHTHKYKGIPEQFYAMTWKLLNDKELCDMDYHIPYKIDDITIDCILNDNFYLNNLY